MRGYFAIGAEGLSKPMNLGNLIRSAHAFGAAFFFTVDADKKLGRPPKSDTSKASEHLPHYAWSDLKSMDFPQGCELVGVELTDDAVDLPRFYHPRKAAYVLGPERGVLSPQMLERCDHIVRIPTRFCINVATAGAIVMYDRITSLESAATRGFRGKNGSPASPPRGHGGPSYSGGRKVSK